MRLTKNIAMPNPVHFAPDKQNVIIFINLTDKLSDAVRQSPHSSLNIACKRLSAEASPRFCRVTPC